VLFAVAELLVTTIRLYDTTAAVTTLAVGGILLAAIITSCQRLTQMSCGKKRRRANRCGKTERLMITMRSNEAENDYTPHLTTLHRTSSRQQPTLYASVQGLPLHYASSQRGRIVHCTAFCTSDCPGLKFKNGLEHQRKFKCSIVSRWQHPLATGHIL